MARLCVAMNGIEIGYLSNQLYPDHQKLPEVKTITSEALGALEIETLLKSYQSSPLGMDREHEFRISLAGAQEKTALLWHKEQWHRATGSTGKGQSP